MQPRGGTSIACPDLLRAGAYRLEIALIIPDRYNQALARSSGFMSRAYIIDHVNYHVRLYTAAVVVTVIMTMYKHWLMVILLILLHSTYDVYAAHFRGAVIMVRPKPGGREKEVLKIIVFGIVRL